LTNADPLAPTQTTPVQIGARDLTALEDNLAVDRVGIYLTSGHKNRKRCEDGVAVVSANQDHEANRLARNRQVRQAAFISALHPLRTRPASRTDARLARRTHGDQHAYVVAGDSDQNEAARYQSRRRE
jgi:hypothetical protein